jgi:hypothetical protein
VRFVLAIVALVVAAVMIGVGIAQRTVLAPPDKVDTSLSVAGGAPFTVISGKVLNSHPGQQTLYVSGGSKQFVAYGRTADVLAWIGTEPYANVTYNTGSNKLTSKVVISGGSSSNDSTGSSTATGGTTPSPTPTATATPTPTPAPSASSSTSTPTLPGSNDAAVNQPGPNPVGSDLWLQEFDGSAAAVTKMNVPDNISVIVASDGTKAAPKTVRLVWPLDDSTPWSGPLIVGGSILLLVGLTLWLLGLYALRKSRGPRRTSGPKMPKLPKSPKYKPSKAIESHSRGRRSTRNAMIGAVPAVLVGTLLLSGCSADYWPSFASTSTPHATSSKLSKEVTAAKGAMPTAVTVPQLERIVTKISAVATDADAHLKPTEIATRFAGPALELRTANYSVRAKDSSEAALPAIPPGPLALTLPQATDSWPRVVETVVQNKANPKQAPIALVLEQQTPRSNYMVNYAMSLEPDAKVPDLAPATVGSAVVPPDSKLLLLPPNQVAAAYGDILLNGTKSKYYDLFNPTGDTLRTAVGSDYKAKMKSEVPATASLTFTNGVGKGAPIAMATNDSGAIVAVNLNEVETLKVVQAGAQVSAGAASAALAGLTGASTTGIVSTYGYQLLFYVPPTGSTQKITLLGFSQGLVAASEMK